MNYNSDDSFQLDNSTLDTSLPVQDINSPPDIELGSSQQNLDLHQLSEKLNSAFNKIHIPQELNLNDQNYLSFNQS
jgi:hypothetical protein